MVKQNMSRNRETVELLVHEAEWKRSVALLCLLKCQSQFPDYNSSWLQFCLAEVFLVEKSGLE